MTSRVVAQSSFCILMKGLKGLRPHAIDQHGRTVLTYRYGGEKKHDHPVLLMEGRAKGIFWVDICIGLVQLRADRLEWATALQQMNRQFSVGRAIPRWMALHETVGVALVHRLDWRNVSPREMDDYILQVLQEVHNCDDTTHMKHKKQKQAANTAESLDASKENMPPDTVRQSFGQLLVEMRSLRPSRQDEAPNNKLLEYSSGVAELLAGYEEGIHWMDVCIRLRGFRIDRLDWARIVLQSNADMALASPIPTWFALDDQQRLLFIHRLDWRHIKARALDDHIRHCIAQMAAAMVAEGVGTVGRHGRPDPLGDHEAG